MDTLIIRNYANSISSNTLKQEVLRNLPNTPDGLEIIIAYCFKDMEKSDMYTVKKVKSNNKIIYLYIRSDYMAEESKMPIHVDLTYSSKPQHYLVYTNLDFNISLFNDVEQLRKKINSPKFPAILNKNALKDWNTNLLDANDGNERFGGWITKVLETNKKPSLQFM